jgi:hypothetical protein
MSTTMNERIINYKTFKIKVDKEKYLKYYIIEHTDCYNHYKKIIEEFNRISSTDVRFINNKEEMKLHTKFYNFRIKYHMSQVLLYNSILKNNKENIIKNFSDFNNNNLDYMEIVEEISENENIKGFYSKDNMEDANDAKNKSGEQYRLVCIEVKEKYELLKYIIEDYNNIKL